jgi:hypothetical protein
MLHRFFSFTLDSSRWPLLGSSAERFDKGAFLRIADSVVKRLCRSDGEDVEHGVGGQRLFGVVMSQTECREFLKKYGVPYDGRYPCGPYLDSTRNRRYFDDGDSPVMVHEHV